MKYLIAILLLAAVQHSASSQFVAKMEIKEDIPGICNIKEVYSLFPMFKGQEEAVCPVIKDSIVKRLNSEVPFLKENTKHKDKGMVNIIINCKGEVVKCEMDNKTKSEELDKQIVAIFNSLGSWKAGKLNGKTVDSSRLWSFEIKKGEITIE
jgi:hypothetical protein